MSIQQEKLLQKFREEYNKLNEEQRRAVDKIYGPVMVVAGPGTGKTQILSVRIGKILIETDYAPSNILCLTYTDAGVLAMRKRLLEMIGPDAYSVNIHSFHSFCNMVIQQNMYLFHKKELQPLSELEQGECLMRLIDSFDAKNPLKRYKADAYYEAPHLRDLFSTMKREGWTPEFLLQKIDAYIEQIPELFYNKVKFKKGIVELTVEGKKEYDKMNKLKAAVKAFPHYQEIVREMRRYDFDDMISWVIQAFENDPDLLLGYQEQFQFLLVDEYQDTSGSQNKLVEFLISYWQEESPNVFVVGDDDQSIYRFQGANMENMMTLAKKYEKDILRVVLTKNYRSVQPILDAAHRLISNNTQRLCNEYPDLEKTLKTARAEYDGLSLLPRVVMLNNEFEENIFVVEEIARLCAQGAKPGKIAVIYKEHRTGEELQKFLQMQGIPYYSKRSINLLEDHFIKKIISFLKFTVAELEIPFSGEHYLFEILHYDLYRISPLRIASICNEIRQNGKHKSENVHLRTYLAETAAKNAGQLFPKDADTEELVRLHRLIEKLLTDSYNLSLLQWIEMVINEAGFLSHIMKQPDKSWLMQLLNGFFNYVQEECRRDPDLTLNQLVRQIDLLEENDISLRLIQTSGNEKGVNLLTCHGSKGLEYEYVFMMGCYSGLWEGKKKYSQGYKLPPTVFEKISTHEAEQELRRLFFVAATRAEKHLYITFPSFTNDGKPLEASRFISEMNADDLSMEAIVISEEDKLKYSMLRYGMIEKPMLQKAEEEFVTRLLSNFKLNVTAINHYLDCPVKFYYSTLLRVPSAINQGMQFGTSMHEAFNHYYNKMMEEKQYPPKEVLVNRFRWHIQHNREVFTPASLERFTEHGIRCLESYYDQFFAGKTEADFIRTEVSLEAVINGVPVKGFADKIQYWMNDIVITDFKTGSLEKSSRRHEFVEPGHDQKPYGGNYWRQAVVYKMLSDRQKGKPKQVRSIQFEFIEPTDKGEFENRQIVVTPEHEAIVEKQIAETWEKIQSHDFYTGCGKPECEWCNFVKEHKLYTTLIEEDEVVESETLFLN